MMSFSRSIRDLQDCISMVWVNVSGGLEVLTFDGETGMRSKDVNDWVKYSQLFFKYKAPHQKTFFVQRHSALIRSASQRAGSQVIKESLCVRFSTVFGLVTFMHFVSISISNRTPHQTFPGRRPILLPPFEGGYHGYLGAAGQNNLVRVRETVAVASVQATAKQRLAGGDKRNQVVAIGRRDHQPRDLVDIWHEPPNKDILGWMGPAQIAFVNHGGGSVIVRFQGGSRQTPSRGASVCATFNVCNDVGISQGATIEHCPKGGWHYYNVSYHGRGGISAVWLAFLSIAGNTWW